MLKQLKIIVLEKKVELCFKKFPKSCKVLSQ